MCGGLGVTHKHPDPSSVAANDSRRPGPGVEAPAEAEAASLSSVQAVLLPRGECSPDVPLCTLTPRSTPGPREAACHLLSCRHEWVVSGLQPIALEWGVVTTHRAAPPVGNSAPAWGVACRLVPAEPGSSWPVVGAPAHGQLVSSVWSREPLFRQEGSGTGVGSRDIVLILKLAHLKKSKSYQASHS